MNVCVADESPPPSPWQQKKFRAWEIANSIRERLRAALGGKCAKCGTTEKLEFHHPQGRTWEPRKMNLRHRMRLYERDFKAGLLDLLCKRCNGTDGNARARFYAAVKNSQTGPGVVVAGGITIYEDD